MEAPEARRRAFEDGHGVAAFGRRPRVGKPDDAGTDNGDVLLSQEKSFRNCVQEPEKCSRLSWGLTDS
jgi:hypothetical protein